MASRSHLCAGVLVATLLAARPLWAAVAVRVEPPEVVVEAGQSFSIDLVADITDPVLGWGLDLNCDELVLSIDGVPTLGPLWNELATSDGDGLGGYAFPGSISGEGILLATVFFSAEAIGETALVPCTTPDDLTEGFPLDPIGFDDVTFETGNVTVVPETVTGLSGLLLGGLRLLRRNPKRGGSRPY